jgi:SH3-like domain-containing protein
LPSLAELKSRIGGLFLAGLALVVLSASIWALSGGSETLPTSSSTASTRPIEGEAVTGKTGPSGLPVPRFVSLKTDLTNMRRGPSSDHAVSYVYHRKGLPVEIVAEFEQWRRIRDAQGDEGWVYNRLLSGKRTVLVSPWKPGTEVLLRATPTLAASPVAKLASGVLADVRTCDGNWCTISAGGFDGYVEQNALFGVYPGEQVED